LMKGKAQGQPINAHQGKGDREMHKKQTREYYAIFSTNVDVRNSTEFITLAETPGRTNMSRDERVVGWLGTTDGHYQEALGVFDEDGARELLQEKHIRIPDDVPVRYVKYMIGYEDAESRKSKMAERYNQAYCYRYQGPWYDIPDHELQFASRPREILDTCMVPIHGEQETFLVLLTCDEKRSGFIARRSWYETDYILDKKRARDLAKSLI